MEDGVTIREIAIWTLTKHRDAVGEHLDLSDEELQNLFRRLCADDPVRFEGVLKEEERYGHAQLTGQELYDYENPAPLENPMDWEK